ncbi:hypothetical protein [Aquimarina longa]|uniref:hypothetical protein n=1 Tax=Aquimarina longa TaxID=1080221 RepID=UPI00078637F2|nr:hypothetical protein [Aquimarina longa]
MRGIHEFIIEVKEPLVHKQKLGNTEIYIDPFFDQTRHTNRIGKVISSPIALDTDIDVGDEVLIVHTVLMSQIYRGQRADSIYLLDKERGYYRLENSLIIMYRKNHKSIWKCNDINVMVTPIKAKKSDYKIGDLILPDNFYNTKIECNTHGYLKQYGIVTFLNKDIEKQGVNIGDTIFFTAYSDYEFRVDGQILYCMDNRDILAVIQ